MALQAVWFASLPLDMGYSVFMPDSLEHLQLLMDSLKQMEMTLMGMKQVRALMGLGSARDILDRLIAEAETEIAEIRQKVIQ